MSLSHYADADGRLSAVIDAVPPELWGAPSPCDGWTARDVLQHIIATQRDFLGARGISLGDAPDVEAGPSVAWRLHADEVMARLADPRVAQQSFEGFFGPTTVEETIDRFYVWDMIVHRWDIARAVDGDTSLTSGELDAIDAGATGFGDALYMEGICRPAAEPPPDAPRTTRVLARLGRDA